jgi:cell wall-associated NlpC family hydrolase
VPRTPAARRVHRGVAALALVGMIAAASTLTASADPGPVYPSQQQVDRAKAAVTGASGQISTLDAQYAAAGARLADVQDRAAAAGEAYNGALFRLDQRKAETAAAQKRSAQAQSVADAASLIVRRYAATVYQQGGNLGELEAFLNGNGPQDMLDRATALQAVGDARARTLQEAAATSIVADTMKRQAAEAQAEQLKAATEAQQAKDAAQAQADQAQAAATQIQQQQQTLVTQLATLRKTSVALEQQRQDGLAAAAAARAAAAEAARQAQLAAARAKAAHDAASRAAALQAAARASAEATRQKAAAQAAEKRAAEASQQQTQVKSQPADPTPAGPAPVDSTPVVSVPPPPSGGASAVIAYARAQLGKPYQWGADGPDSFDCSGLTMRAWQQAGVSLYHYTGAQWDQTARVAISDLRPGDLVFYGSSGPSSHHVGLYIGDGQMIEAPRSGVPVRVASIYRYDLLPYGGRP